MKKEKIIISLTPDLSQLINECVAAKVKVNGKFMTRQEFLAAELTTHLTQLLNSWKEMTK